MTFSFVLLAENYEIKLALKKKKKIEEADHTRLT